MISITLEIDVPPLDEVTLQRIVDATKRDAQLQARSHIRCAIAERTRADERADRAKAKAS